MTRGIMLVPWQSDKLLCWDVTVSCPLAESYIDRAALEAGAAVEMAATHKQETSTSVLITSLSQLQYRPWVFSTHQLVTSWMILEALSLKTRARLERPASCSKGFRYWCSASMLSFCMTVCWLKTSQTDDRNQFCIFFSIFKLPRDYMYRGSKKMIIIKFV